MEVSRQEYWAAIPFSRGSSQLRVWTQVSCIAGRFSTIWATSGSGSESRSVQFSSIQSLSHVQHFATPWTKAWRRQWHPTPVLLSRKSHRRRSLVGCSPWGPLRVGHDWATSLSLFTFMHWRRKWQPTPVFLPGESQGQRSLVGCQLWGCTESDTTELT